MTDNAQGRRAGSPTPPPRRGSAPRPHTHHPPSPTTPPTRRPPTDGITLLLVRARAVSCGPAGRCAGVPPTHAPRARIEPLLSDQTPKRMAAGGAAGSFGAVRLHTPTPRQRVHLPQRVRQRARAGPHRVRHRGARTPPTTPPATAPATAPATRRQRLPPGRTSHRGHPTATAPDASSAAPLTPATPPGPAAHPAPARTKRTPGERTLPRPGAATDHTPSHTHGHTDSRQPLLSYAASWAAVPLKGHMCAPIHSRAHRGVAARGVRALPRRSHRVGGPPGGRSHPAHTAPPATTPAKVRWQFLSPCAPTKPSPRAGRPPRAPHLKAQLEPQMPLK